jgi:dTDP-4-dehydrorhamnose 3,5-epimerase
MNITPTAIPDVLIIEPKVFGAENKKQLWIPPGFAHGFLTLTYNAEFMYKTSDYYSPTHERVLRWNDPEIGINWALNGEPILAAKDATGSFLKDID